MANEGEVELCILTSPEWFTYAYVAALVRVGRLISIATARIKLIFVTGFEKLFVLVIIF